VFSYHQKNPTLQGDVVEFLFSIKGIDPVSTPNILFDDLLMLFQSITGDVFKVVASEVIHIN
jgi:hypothetical protein